MKKKLKIKDLISIGIFAALYLVGYFGLTMLWGMIPVLYFLSPALNGFLLAPIFMLVAVRVQKNNAVLLFGIFCPLVVAVMHNITLLPYIVPIVLIIIAEFFARKARYNQYSMLSIAYTSYALWPLGMFSSFIVAKDALIEMMREFNYSEAYISAYQSMLRIEIIVGVAVLTVIGALLGCLFAKKLLNKHFKKAGII